MSALTWGSLHVSADVLTCHVCVSALTCLAQKRTNWARSPNPSSSHKGHNHTKVTLLAWRSPIIKAVTSRSSPAPVE